MKKILFATTALVATAGIASAEIKEGGIQLVGSAEMGILGGEDTDGQFHTDLDMDINFYGEADNGLTFGASIDLDEVGGGIPNTSGPDASFVAYGGARLDMGDVDGAFDWAMSELDFGGAINDDHTAHAGFSGNGGLGAFNSFDDASDAGAGLDGLYDGQIARFTYTFGDFAVAGSLEVADDRDVEVNLFNLDEDDPDYMLTEWNRKPLWGIGGTWSANGLTVGAGYQFAKIESKTSGYDDLDFEVYGGSIQYSWNDFTVGAEGSQTSLESGDYRIQYDHWGVGIEYTMNALTLAANYGEYNADVDDLPDLDIGDQSGWGIAADYALGGGVTVQFGYGDSSYDNADDTNTYSLGLAMKF